MRCFKGEEHSRACDVGSVTVLRRKTRDVKVLVRDD